MSHFLTISVIIPVYNGARTLPWLLSALASANPSPFEIVVVDDGSTDGSGALALQAGCRVIRLDHNIGAASAKNRGAAQAKGDILLFTDADILPQGDIIARLEGTFKDSQCDAIVGLLDPDIPEQNLASQYKNLWMNFTYSRFYGRDRIGLFYTSVAAIRRDCFISLGGFDENYRGASIAEDTEFGQRAWSHGARIRLDCELRVVHMKRYGLTGMLQEDFRRAAALTRMKLRKWKHPFFTSVPLTFQLAVPLVYLAVVAVTLVVLSQNPAWLNLLAFAAILFYLLNVGFITFLVSRRGFVFAAQSCLLLPADALVVGLGMLFAAADFARGRRY